MVKAVVMDDKQRLTPLAPEAAQRSALTGYIIQAFMFGPARAKMQRTQSRHGF